MDPQAQYMRPAKLLRGVRLVPLREPDRRDEWDERDDIARNGFRWPAVLEYNHLTGQGFLGEGNHRLGIGFELDRALPTVSHERDRGTKLHRDFARAGFEL